MNGIGFKFIFSRQIEAIAHKNDIFIGMSSFGASAPAKDLYKHFDLDSPISEASTISGHILEIAKRIPLFGERVKDEHFIFKVLSHSRKQISKIEITPIK